MIRKSARPELNVHKISSTRAKCPANQLGSSWFWSNRWMNNTTFARKRYFGGKCLRLCHFCARASQLCSLRRQPNAIRQFTKLHYNWKRISEFLFQLKAETLMNTTLHTSYGHTYNYNSTQYKAMPITISMQLTNCNCYLNAICNLNAVCNFNGNCNCYLNVNGNCNCYFNAILH